MTKQEIYFSLSRGAGIVVSFGAHGEQYAHCIGTNRHGAPQIRIWRKATGRWTKPRKLQLGEIIRHSTREDEHKFKPDFGPAWERD